MNRFHNQNCINLPQKVVTISKMVGVVVVIIGGLVRLGQGHVDSFKTGFDKLDFLNPLGPASIGMIAFNGLWSYGGWNNLNLVAGEIKVGTILNQSHQPESLVHGPKSEV